MLRPPNILTIAGSDSGGGAGIQADLKTIMALGGYGTCAITALTAQNGAGVTGVECVKPNFVALQLETVLSGFKIDAAKTGMLFSKDVIESIYPILQKRTFPLVVDPVCVSQSGFTLLEDSAIEALIRHIIPGCDLLTPNIPEAELLTGMKIDNEKSAFEAGEKIAKNMAAKAVLIKGGHLQGVIMSSDFLYRQNQENLAFHQPHIDTENNHGTGCTLSAAIACYLGMKMPLEIAIKKAQEYLNLALRKSYNPGIGHGPVNHASTFF